MRVTLSRILLVLLGAACAVSTQAQSVSVGVQWHSGDIRHFESRDMHHWRNGYWHQGHYQGRYGWWWVVGGVWYFYPQPVYPYPDPYRPPVIVEQVPAAPVVVQVPVPVTVQPAPVVTTPAAPAPVQQFWYYCDAAKGYYPYVASCPSGWRTVPAQPQGVSK